MRSMLIAVLTFVLPAAAQNNACSAGEDTIEIVNIGPVFSMAAVAAPTAASAANAAELDVIANLGQKIWKIVVDNKPVVDAKTQYATALPKGVADWSAMEGWQPTIGNIYELKVKNAFCATVVDFQYQVLRTAGGSYNGAGKYLTAVSIQPMFLEVAWGYRVSVEALVPDSSIVNVGTHERPIAAMTAELAWRISTPIKDMQGKSIYYLQGDGVYQELGGPLQRENKTLPYDREGP